jgi:hypothetical protein
VQSEVKKLATQMRVKIGLSCVNGLMALALYVAHAHCAYLGIVKPAVSVLAEMCLSAGIITFSILVFSKRAGEDPVSYSIWMLIVTLWNQTCMLALLVSLIPFYSYSPGIRLPPEQHTGLTRQMGSHEFCGSFCVSSDKGLRLGIILVMPRL